MNICLFFITLQLQRKSVLTGEFNVSRMPTVKYRMVPIDPRNVNDTLSTKSIKVKNNDLLDIFNNDTHKHWFKEIYSIALGKSAITEEQVMDLSCILGKDGYRCCSCMSKCTWHKDCCIDKHFLYNPKPPLEYMKAFHDNTLESNTVCSPILSNLPYGHKSLKVMMVTKCFYKGLVSKANQEKCENIDQGDFRSFVPVGADNGIVYRNRYCALCNGANFGTKMFFDIIYQGCINKITKPEGVNLKSEEQAKEALNLSNFLSQSVNCTVSLRAKNPFHNSMIQLCTFSRNQKVYGNNTDNCTEMEKNLCLSFAAFTRSNSLNQLFYNPMCAKCLHGSSYPTRFDKCIDDFHTVNPDFRGHFFTPFSVLISFRKKTAVRLIAESEFGDRKIHDSILCKEDEYFDLMKEKCLQLSEIPDQMSPIGHKVDGLSRETEKCLNRSLNIIRYDESNETFTLDGKNNISMNENINRADVDPCGNKRSNTPSVSSVVETKEWEAKLSRAEETISISFLGLSCITLPVTIFVHLKVRDLQTMQSKIMVMLCSSIFGSDVTILFGILGKQYILCCKVVAIMLHWFGLSMHFWTLLILSDLNRSVNSAFQIQTYSSTRFALYNILAWGVAFAIILVCITLDEVYHNMIAYGVNGLCWISSYNAHLIAYLVPTVVTTLVNVVLVVRLAVFLKKRLSEDVSSLELVHKKRVEMYHKLMYKVVLLFGILEVVGFIQLGEEDEIRKVVSLLFRVLYNVIRSMRGFFVFLVLVVFCPRARNGVVKFFEGQFDNTSQ